MANKEYVYFDGTVKFINQTTPNQWGKWSLQMYINNDNRDKLIDLQAQGVKNTLKKDDQGYFTTFSRPSNKEYPSGDIVKFEPPIVVDENDKVTSALIGRGSEVTAKIEVYSHPIPNSKQRGKALRWEGVKILKLVNDNGPKDDSPEPVW